RVLQDLCGVIEKVGKERGLVLIVEKRGAAVLYGASEADLTDEIIRAYDQQNPGKDKKYAPMAKGVGFTLRELARALHASLEGDAAAFVTGVAPLESAGPDQISFLVDLRYAEAAK